MHAARWARWYLYYHYTKRFNSRILRTALAVACVWNNLIHIIIYSFYIIRHRSVVRNNSCVIGSRGVSDTDSDVRSKVITGALRGCRTPAPPTRPFVIERGMATDDAVTWAGRGVTHHRACAQEAPMMGLWQ